MFRAAFHGIMIPDRTPRNDGMARSSLREEELRRSFMLACSVAAVLVIATLGLLFTLGPNARDSERITTERYQ